MKSGTFAAIDVGTTKICTLVGEIAAGTGETRVLGVGITPSAGLSRGGVDNVREATESIRASVEKAERASGTRILSAHIGLSGVHVDCMNNRGIVAVPDRRHPIGPDDIARALEGARIVSIPTNREVLHVLPRYFIVDGQDHVSDPVGMFGQRLDVDAHIITVPGNAVANITKVVEGAGVTVDDVVLQPLAGAEAVLTEEERRQGVILADIGGGCTDISVFVEGSIHHTATVPIGGNHITRDLVIGLRCPYRSAEMTKEKYGSALPSTVPEGDTVDLETFGAERNRTYTRRLVCEIIQARCEEILEMTVNEVQKATSLKHVSAGLVITGGTGRLPNLDRLTEQVTDLPARIGLPTRIHGLVDELHDPAYAASVGLLQWSMGEQDISSATFGAGVPGPFDGLFKRLGNWARVLMPE